MSVVYFANLESHFEQRHDIFFNFFATSDDFDLSHVIILLQVINNANKLFDSLT